MEERIAKLEILAETNSKQIDTIQKKVDNITELTIAVKEIAIEVKNMREEMGKLTDRVDQIEKEPAEDYKEIRKGILKQVVTFIVGGIISGITVFLAK